MAGKFGNIFTNAPQWLDKLANAQTPEAVKKLGDAVHKLATAKPASPVPNSNSVNNRPFQNLFPVGGRPSAGQSSTDSVEKGFNSSTLFASMQELSAKLQGRTLPTGSPINRELQPPINKVATIHGTDNSDIELQLVNQRIDSLDVKISAVELNVRKINDRLIRVESRLAALGNQQQVGYNADPILGFNPSITYKFGASQFGGPPPSPSETAKSSKPTGKSGGWFDWLWKNKKTVGAVAGGVAVGGGVALGGDGVRRLDPDNRDDALQFTVKRDAITLKAKVLTIDADKIIWLKDKPSLVSATGPSTIAPSKPLERPEHSIDPSGGYTTGGTMEGGPISTPSSPGSGSPPSLGRLPQSAAPSASPSIAGRARRENVPFSSPMSAPESDQGPLDVPSAPTISRPQPSGRPQVAGRTQPTSRPQSSPSSSVGPAAAPDGEATTDAGRPLPGVTRVDPSARQKPDTTLDADPIKYAQKLAASHGWTKEGTAALLGQVKQESSFNPYEIGDGGKSYGLFQMNNFGRSNGKEGRLDRLETIMKQHTGLNDPLQYIRDVKAGRIKPDPEITKKMVAAQFEHFTANDVDAKINTDRVKAGLQSKSIEEASQSIIGAIRPKNWIEQGTAGWDYQKRVTNARQIYNQIDIDGQRQPAQQADGDSRKGIGGPSRFVFNTDQTYGRGDIERVIQKNPGDKILFGGNIENPGHDAAMKYAQDRGHLTHDYLIGPGEPAKGYDGKGVAFQSDQDEIARHTKSMGITRKQWDEGGWKDWNFQKWKEANAKGRYSIEMDNFNNQSDPEAIKTLQDFYGRMTKENDGKPFSTKFMLKNASPEYMQGLEKQWQLHEQTKGAQGLPRSMFSDFGVAEQFMKPDDRRRAAEVARRNGIEIGNTTHSDPRYQQYRTDDKGFVNQANASGRTKNDDTTLVKSKQHAKQIIADAAAGKISVKSMAVDRAMQMEGLHERRDRDVLAEYLKDGGTNINPAKTAWCAAFVNTAMANAGMKGTGSLVATSFMNWGELKKVADAERGDVLVEPNGRRPGQTGGHVGMATGQFKRDRAGNITHVEMYGGNQKDQTSRKWVRADQVMVRGPTDKEFKSETLDAIAKAKKAKEEPTTLAEAYKKQTGNFATLKPLMGEERETEGFKEWKQAMVYGPPAAQVSPEQITPKAPVAPEVEDRLPGTIGQADGIAERRTEAKQADETQHIDPPKHDPEKEGKSPGSDGYASREDEVLEL